MKRNFKKLIAVASTIVLTLSLTSCGTTNEGEAKVDNEGTCSNC